MTATSKQRKRPKKQSSITTRERLRNRRIARVLGVFVSLVLAFSLGFFVRSQTAFVASLGFSVQGFEETGSASMPHKTTYESISKRVEEAENFLTDFSLDTYDLNDTTTSMLDAFMKETNDPNAAYFDAARYANYIKESSEGSYAGIGVMFSEYDGRAYAADVFSGSEAQAKGVTEGDYVTAIDGDGSHNWTVSEVINSLAREDGQEVVITWMRPATADAGTGQTFTTTLTCKYYEAENLTSTFENGVGYIKLRQMSQNAADLVRSAVADLTNQGAQAFVFDLRGNPGGYLTQAIDIASLFIQSGILVQIETNQGVSTRTATGATVTDKPMVVLINSYTSGSAEVLAAALQDNQRAEVIGQTSRGKGSVQVVRELSFGGALRYTAAYYLTPLGHALNGVGVVPNIAITDAVDNEGGDTQLIFALDTVRSLVGSAAS